MVKHKIKSKKSDAFEVFVLAVAIAEPLSNIPQLIMLFRTKNAEGLSLLTWVLFFASSVVWLVYGVKTKSKPLIASSVLWASSEILLILGIILYS